MFALYQPHNLPAVFRFLSSGNFSRIELEVDKLKQLTSKELIAQGFTTDNIDYEVYLHLRYKGTDCALMCSTHEERRLDDAEAMCYDAFLTTFLQK